MPDENEIILDLPLDAIDGIPVVEGMPFPIEFDPLFFFGEVPEYEFDEDPLFFLQIGTPDPDVLEGVEGEINVLVGLGDDDDLDGTDDVDIILAGAGADTVFAGGGIDFIYDGLGDDRINAGEGDDLVLIKAGEKDRVDLGGGEDLVMLSPEFFLNGEADRVKVLNYDPAEDYIDTGIGVIADVKELNKEVQITFDTGDMLVVRGVNMFDDINFIDLQLPELATLVDFLEELLAEGEADFPIDDDDEDGHMGGGDDDEDMDEGDLDDLGEVFFSPDDGNNLRGTELNDFFGFEGTGTMVALGDAGADTFVIFEDTLNNGSADKVKIRDYDVDEGDEVVVQGEIVDVKELANRTQVFVGDEGDFIEFVGVTDFDDINIIETDPLAIA